jgi:hypothetical protein
MSYRFDNRSKSEFKKDIKNSHIAEAQIAVRICLAHYIATGVWLDLKPNGIDMTGQYKETVTSDPDFIIGKKVTEITRADTLCDKFFHWKVNKIKRAIKDEVYTVFVNGFRVQKEPKFIMISAKILAEKTKLAIEKYGETKHPGSGGNGFVNKASYRYDLDWFKGHWRMLPILTKDIEIPEEYRKIINNART